MGGPTLRSIKMKNNTFLSVPEEKPKFRLNYVNLRIRNAHFNEQDPITVVIEGEGGG